MPFERFGEAEIKHFLSIARIIVLVPIYLVSFVVVHEVGHTVLARLLGDPESVFYLVQINREDGGTCLGCNIYDPSKLSPLGNFVVSLGGLGFTQALALGALFLIHQKAIRSPLRRLLAALALSFAFLDVPVQVIQGLLYDLEQHTWPTNVDLMDAMLLIQEATGASQLPLKAILGFLALAYLSAFVLIYRRNQSLANPAKVQKIVS
jgi:hypothetical protein